MFSTNAAYMCKFAIINHLKTEGVRLQEFSRVLAFFELDAKSLKACEALVSVHQADLEKRVTNSICLLCRPACPRTIDLPVIFCK